MRKEITSNVDTPDFWDHAYKNGNDRWSLNSANPVFVQILKDGKFYRKGDKLLIAGSGKGHDAVEAEKYGLKVTALDFSAEAVEANLQLKKELDSKIEIVKADLFDVGNAFPSKFDLIYEYVTFCAVPPDKIEQLLNSLARCLAKDGRIISILFPVDGRKGGPPFAIDLKNFFILASKYFSLEYFQKKVPSIKPRRGNEVLMVLRKRDG